MIPDIRHALRSFLRYPGVFLTAGVSLAAGIGAATAIFSLVSALFFRPLPGIAPSGRLVELSRAEGNERSELSYPAAEHLASQTGVLQGVAAFVRVSASIRAKGEPEVLGGLAVTRSYFQLLGVRPSTGRDFAPGEAEFPRTEPVAIVSETFAERSLGGTRDALGRVIRLNGTAVTVIGVLPAGFSGHQAGLLADVFVPLGLPAAGLPGAGLRDPGAAEVETLGLLQPDVRLSDARAALTEAARQFESSWKAPAEEQEFGIEVTPWGPLPVSIRGAAAAVVGVLFLVVLLGLIIASANVATVLLARAAEREREFAVRRALGAGNARLVGQLTTEVAVLFLVSGAIGVALAAWVTRVLARAAPSLPIPGRVGLDLSPDWRVFAFAFGASLVASLIVSIGPVLHATRKPVAGNLRNSGLATSPARSRIRSFLVGLQVGVMSLLLILAALVGRGLSHLKALDTGWRSEGLVVMTLNLELDGTGAEKGRAFFSELLHRVREEAGVEAAALARKLPLGGRSSFGPVTPSGAYSPASGTGYPAFLNRISSGYFETLDVPLLQGRDFSDGDAPGSPRVAIINLSMAERVWPGEDPIGRHFVTGTGASIEVVGVAEDVKYGRLDEATPNFYYVPEAQWYNAEMTLHVRPAPGMTAPVTDAIRRIVRGLDPQLPMPALAGLSDAMDTFLIPQRLAAWVTGGMGGFGLLLACLGLYGVTAFVIARRDREIAVRLALGATPRDILRLMLAQGGLAPALGLAGGVLVGLPLGYGVAQTLSGIDPVDPVAFTGVPLLAGCIVVAAIMVPVTRMLRRDPMAALRED